jgi:ubiquinol-cytochrome c reductase cytochrome c1 subunit
MLRKALVIAASAGLILMTSAPAFAATAGEEPHSPEGGWSFKGPFGKFDQAELQRGYKVYHEVCSQCHSMNLMSFRTLGQKDGPFYDPKYDDPNKNPYVKALAADVQVNDIDTDTGDNMKRPGTPADTFPAPYANSYAAAAALHTAPPDLSVMAKAREGGADYIYSLLTGYGDPPKGLINVPANGHFNAYFPADLSSSWTGAKNEVPKGGFIAMPPPLTANKVSFDDGTPSTVANEAKSVAAFLTWASEPKQTERKQLGFMVMIYLLLLAGLVYASYRQVWRNESH